MTLLDEIKNEIRLTQNQSPASGTVGSDDIAVAQNAILTRARGGFTRGYHMEFIFDDVGEARALTEILAQYDIFAHLTTTVDNLAYRVYIKDSDCICNLLALVGANRSLLKLHDRIILRDVRNSSNRRANCDAANIGRQVAAAAADVGLFSRLVLTADFEKLPAELQQTARVRIENPDVGYTEIAAILGISKAGLAHRLERLRALGQFLKPL